MAREKRQSSRGRSKGYSSIRGNSASRVARSTRSNRRTNTRSGPANRNAAALRSYGSSTAQARNAALARSATGNASPNMTSAATGRPVYAPPPGAPNMTSAATGRPVYAPPPGGAVAQNFTPIDNNLSTPESVASGVVAPVIATESQGESGGVIADTVNAYMSLGQEGVTVNPDGTITANDMRFEAQVPGASQATALGRGLIKKTSSLADDGIDALRRSPQGQQLLNTLNKYVLNSGTTPTNVGAKTTNQLLPLNTQTQARMADDIVRYYGVDIDLYAGGAGNGVLATVGNSVKRRIPAFLLVATGIALISTWISNVSGTGGTNLHNNNEVQGSISSTRYAAAEAGQWDIVDDMTALSEEAGNMTRGDVVMAHVPIAGSVSLTTDKILPAVEATNEAWAQIAAEERARDERIFALGMDPNESPQERDARRQAVIEANRAEQAERDAALQAQWEANNKIIEDARAEQRAADAENRAFWESYLESKQAEQRRIEEYQRIRDEMRKAEQEEQGFSRLNFGLL